MEAAFSELKETLISELRAKLATVNPSVLKGLFSICSWRWDTGDQETKPPL